MSKTKIISIAVILSAIILACVFVSFYFIQQQKLSVSYILSKSRGPENWNEEISPGEEYASYEIKAKKYKYYGSEFFDEIVEIDQNSGDSKQFAFRTSTGWNNMQNIEIGRIELPYADKNVAIKCSFNYRGDENWQPCTEKQFLKALGTIFELKLEKGKQYEEAAKKLSDLEKECESDNASFLGCVSEYSKLQQEMQTLLKETRNTTIQLKK